MRNGATDFRSSAPPEERLHEFERPDCGTPEALQVAGTFPKEQLLSMRVRASIGAARRSLRFLPILFAEKMRTKTLETLLSFMKLVLLVHRPRLLLGHRPKWFALRFSMVKYR